MVFVYNKDIPIENNLFLLIYGKLNFLCLLFEKMFFSKLSGEIITIIITSPLSVILIDDIY